MMDATPDGWFRAAREGDRGALGRVLEERLKGQLVRLAWRKYQRLARKGADLEDLVQETFATAVRDFPAFRGESLAAFTWWVTRIFEHRALKAVGREKAVADLPEDVAAAGSSPSSRAKRQETTEWLDRVIETLEGKEHTVFVLYHREGRSHAEIAPIVGVTADGARRIYLRALYRVQKRIPAGLVGA